MGEVENKIAQEIVRRAEATIGTTALTIARSEGLEISGKSVKAETAGYLERLVEAYRKIIGPVAKTLAFQGAQEALAGFKKEEIDLERDRLPEWARPSVAAKFSDFFGSF